MRRFYQESWQGIPFTSFSHISFYHLAEPKFYAVFYEELFRRYKNWDDLPSVWRDNKRTDAKWLIGQLRAKLAQESGQRTGPVRVLSIGSGVGYMERILLEEMPELELHVNEPSTVGLFHGECVALGMLPMIESKALQKRVRAVYRRLGLPLRTTYNKEKVLAEMLHDKKAQGGQITIIKVPGLGCWRAETIPVEGLRPLLGMEE